MSLCMDNIILIPEIEFELNHKTPTFNREYIKELRIKRYKSKILNKKLLEQKPKIQNIQPKIVLVI